MHHRFPRAATESAEHITPSPYIHSLAYAVAGGWWVVYSLDCQAAGWQETHHQPQRWILGLIQMME